LGVEALLLTGTVRGAEREQALARIASGACPVVIGTHALFQDQVTFHDLAFVVVDEQHRFGVEQRLKLTQKGNAPHLLVMTATPIPRTLMLTAFGDMESSQLKEKPPGRKPVDTRTLPLERAEEVVARIRVAVEQGAKVYWICPLIEEGDNDEGIPRLEEKQLAAAEQRYREFRHLFGERVGLAHGRMKSEERQQVMQGFAGDRFDVLVATTVVEVGVNVPEATIMIIEHAEQFGLSQLHQLRGRVGRGEKPSSCLLLYGNRLSDTAKERLKVMRATEDGFEIAEADARLRGTGEWFGTRQSGLPTFHFANLEVHRELLFTARDQARLLMHRDPELKSPEGQAARILLYLLGYDASIRYLKAG
jgi:ATP-dependent DNA helicase RecG